MGNTLVRQIDNSLVVWFETSNQWIMMNEPQGFIFHLYKKGVSPDEVIQLIRNEFTKDEYGFEWVSKLYQDLDVLDNKKFPFPDFSEGASSAMIYNPPFISTHTYRSGVSTFSISYGNKELENYIHLPFVHLVCDLAGAASLHMEVYTFEGRYVLRINGSRCLTADESPQIKRLLFVELANHLWRKTDNNWLSHLHASAVVCDNRLILLASPSGSGKSTMAALLINKGEGCRLFADDFIPVSKDDRLLYPFPAALSIKAGSLPVMAREGIAVDLVKGNVGYINQHTELLTPLSSQIMVFVQYRKDAATRLEKILPSEALRPFLQESWVTNTLQGAEAFWEWFTGLSFYTLEYSNNDEAVEAVMRIPYLSL